MYKILSGVVIAVLILFGSDTKAGVYKISPSGDTWIYNVTPDAALGNDGGLATDLQNYSPKGFVFLKFNIPAFPNEVIRSATLHLCQYDGAGYGEGPTALVLIDDDNWNESTLTWNNALNGPNYLFPLLSTCSDGRSHRGWSSWSFPWDFSYGNTITLRVGENSSGDQVHVYYSSEYYGVFPGIESGLEPYLEIVTESSPYGVAAGYGHTLGLKANGTVVAAGKNDFGQLEVGAWSGIVQVAAGESHTVALRSDGTVVAAGDNFWGQLEVVAWSGIVQVAAGTWHTVGLKADGTVVAVGYNGDHQLDVGSWKGMVQVAAGVYHTVGLRSDGTVVAAGHNGYYQLDVGAWSGIVQVAAGGHHTVGLKSDGTVVAAGYKGDGQRDVSSWQGIIEVAEGSGHTVGLRSDGTVVAVGDHSFGQLDVGSWMGIMKVAAGDWHTVGLKSDGTVLAVGYNDFDQLNVGSWNLFEVFADVPPEYWAYDYIMAIYDAQITAGCSTDAMEYCPEAYVTREQMAVFLIRALNQVPEDGYCGSTPPFSDVAADRWSCKYVKKLVELGITSGIGGGFFGPEDPVTREQMAVFITRALKEVPVDGYCGMTSPFTDVPYEYWSCKYVKRLVELGITAGIGQGLYGPVDEVTRAQMAVFLYRAFLAN